MNRGSHASSNARPDVRSEARPDASLDAAYDLCARITRERGANFSVGFDVLPTAKLRAVHASYAFCRLIDDFADDPSPGQDAPGLLALWRRELAAAYHGTPSHPVALALADTVRRFPVPRRAFADLIRGCEQDLHFEAPFDVSAVRRYCDLVATPIGEISIAIFGSVVPSTRAAARHLAHALQWTNIVRDVAEDAARGRVYLPLRWWREEGVDLQHLHLASARPAVLRVIGRGVAVARAHYLQAAGLPERIAPDARPTVRLMASVYGRVLERIEQRPERVLSERVELTPQEKLALQQAESRV